MAPQERRITSIERLGLTVLDGFLGLSAVLGGIILLTGFYAPPRELLIGSPFSSYTIPGLALLILIGGGGAAAAILVARRSPWGAPATALIGAMLLIFEAIEFFVIGFTGLLAFEVVLGLLLIALAVHLDLNQRRQDVAV